jgi:plastocyanin
MTVKQILRIFHSPAIRSLQRMGKAVCIFWFLFLFGIANPVSAYAASPSTGTVSGKIGIYRTRAKTEGPKSDKDVIIYLQPVSGDSFGPVKANVKMDQKGLVFIPHVMPIQLGTTVTFLNNDNELHNVYFLFDRTGETLDIGTWGPGQTVDYTFNDAGMAITLCKLHLEMAAYIVVLDTPFYTLAEVDGSSQKGQFEIKDVPAGNYVLHSWHKKFKQKGGPVEVVVQGGNTTVSDIIITKAKYAK